MPDGYRTRGTVEQAAPVTKRSPVADGVALTAPRQMPAMRTGDAPDGTGSYLF